MDGTTSKALVDFLTEYWPQVVAVVVIVAALAYAQLRAAGRANRQAEADQWAREKEDRVRQARANVRRANDSVRESMKEDADEQHRPQA